MYEFRFSFRITAETNISTASLEVQEVGAGRNFTVAVCCRQPYFQVISGCRAKAQVTGAKTNYTIGQAQKLQHFFCIEGESFQFIPRFFRFGEFNQFYFVELVHTNQATSIATCSASFCTEAAAVCGVSDGQFCRSQDFITMIVGYRNFSGRNEIHIAVFQFKHIFCEFRQLTSTLHARTIYDERREHFGIAMFFGVQVKEEADYSAFQTSTQTTIENIASTGYFNTTFKVDDVQAFANIPVSFRFKIKFAGFTPSAYNRVSTVISTNGNIVSRNVGDGEQDFFQTSFDFFQFFIVFRNFVTQSTNCCHLFSCILTSFFQLANFLRCSVAFAFQGFYLNSDFATFFI